MCVRRAAQSLPDVVRRPYWITCFPEKCEIHTTKCLAKNFERNRYKKNSNTIQTHKYCEIKKIDNRSDIVRVHTRSVQMLLQLILTKELPIGMALCRLFEFL